MDFWMIYKVFILNFGAKIQIATWKLPFSLIVGQFLKSIFGAKIQMKTLKIGFMSDFQSFKSWFLAWKFKFVVKWLFGYNNHKPISAWCECWAWSKIRPQILLFPCFLYSQGKFFSRGKFAWWGTLADFQSRNLDFVYFNWFKMGLLRYHY